MSKTANCSPSPTTFSWRSRRFNPSRPHISSRAQAARIARGGNPGPFRLRKKSRSGLWYVSSHRAFRLITRDHARSTKSLLASSPLPLADVPQAVRKSMKGNKGKDTKPELVVRKRLRDAGLTGYRLQWKAPGRPDVAWPGKRVAIFINGCFWHRCPHCNPSMPKSNQEYWIPKFQRNVERDARNMEALRADGWRVHVIWECELKKKTIEHTFATLLPELRRELGR